MNRILALVFILTPAVLFASVQKEQPLSVLKELEATKERLKKKDAQERKLKSLLYSTAKKLEKLSDQEREIEEEISQAKSKISERLSGLKIKKEVIQAEHRKILKRFRLISTWYKSGIGDLLFSSKNVRELDKRMFYLRKVVSLDAERLHSYSNDVRSYDKERGNLKGKIRSLAKLKASLDKKKKQMAKLSRYHKNILAKVYKEKSFAIKEITKIRKRNKELLERLSLDQREFYTLKGRLKLPVMGEIVQNFGVVPKENRRVSLYSNGIKIAVKENKKVFSVAPGRVSFLGELEGYGMTVVIDHGDRYYSVYSNLRLGDIAKGDEISMNTMIGRVGGYPEETRNYLHFELRKFSEAIDPVPWIKKKYINLAKTQSNQTSM